MGLINGVVGLENVKDAGLWSSKLSRAHGDQERSVEKLDQYAKPARCSHNKLPISTSMKCEGDRTPQDVSGMHFFSPANVMKLCEIVRAEKTARTR